MSGLSTDATESLSEDPLDAVLFDIDGTLCEYERTIADLLTVAFDRTGVEPFFSAADYKARFNTFTNESADVDTLRERCFADIAVEYGRDPDLCRDIARAYATERDHSRVRWLDGSREVLDAFDADYRLAAVTNGGPGMQSQKLDALGVDCFETVVHAGYDTPAKPDPRPFEVALAAVETPPERALYIGDSVEADIAGARNAGLRVAWLSHDRTDPTPTPDFTLDSPAELLDRPWRGSETLD